MKIFIVEDDSLLREELGVLLSSYGYEYAYSNDFQNIINHIINSKADLVLLDINLPYFDGYHICRELRKISAIPIIVVTSRNSEMDELMSMNLGADDFITKPYNNQILLAHIAAVLKRTENSVGQNNEITHGGATISFTKSTVSHKDKTLELTKNELKILSLLVRNAGETVMRDELMEELWQSDEFVDDNTLTVNINRLRHKLNNIGLTDFIKTKRGRGYIV